MKYEIVKPEGAPEWFVPGIKCKVWDCEEGAKHTETVMWYKEGIPYPFRCVSGVNYVHAEPIELWEPKIGEPVATFDDNNSYYVVRPFGLFDDGFARSCYGNIARYDGQKDMRVEALKDAPRFK